MSDTCQLCSSGSSTHTHTHTHTHTTLNIDAIWPQVHTHTSLHCLYVCPLCMYYMYTTLTLVRPLYSKSIFLPFIQTSRDVSWKNILSLIKTKLGVTQSSLSSRKNLPSQTRLLKGFRKTHSSLEKLSHTHTHTNTRTHTNDSLFS